MASRRSAQTARRAAPAAARRPAPRAGSGPAPARPKPPAGDPPPDPADPRRPPPPGPPPSSDQGTSIKDAIREFDERMAALRAMEADRPEALKEADPLNLVPENRGLEGAAEWKKVCLTGVVPPITKMDGGLAVLAGCEHLSVGSNAIDKLGGLASLPRLRVLSCSRNAVKGLAAVGDLGATLEELWCSYNQIRSLQGVERLPRLRVLFCSNNLLADWDALEPLSGLAALADLNLLGNPLYGDLDEAERRVEVLRRVPSLKKLDGKAIEPDEVEAAGLPPR